MINIINTKILVDITSNPIYLAIHSLIRAWAIVPQRENSECEKENTQSKRIILVLRTSKCYNKVIILLRFMSLGNLTGIPGMTLPIGYDDNGLPISLQIMSGWWQEHVMLRVAKATEGLIDRRQPEVYYNILE